MKKQRLSKKFGAIMVALTLVAGTFGMSGLFANAAVIGGGGGDGNQQPQRGNITIHKYAMEDITEATWQGTGSSTDIRNVPASATPLGNIGFKVYAVSPVSGAYPADRNFTLNKDEAGVVTGILSEGITYTVAQVGNDLITNKEGIAVTETLPKGVYLVEEQDSVDPESGKSINVVKVAPFLVNMPMTSADGKGWISDIHVFPKNQTVSPTKTPLNGSSVSVGDVKTWKVAFNVPENMVESAQLIVSDTLDGALTYKTDSVKVYGLTESSRARGVRTEITDAVTESVIFDVGESTVAFEFKEEKFHEIAKYSGIEMEFDTVVGKEILEREGATVENDADLGFTDKSGILHLFKTPKPAKIHIGTILVKKVGGDNNPLDGAIFHLASSEDNAKKGNYLKMGAENVLVDFNEPGYDGATPWNGEPVPGQVGQVAFEGVNDLDENDVPKTYWLVEEKAPAGYNKLSGPIAVTFEADKATEANDYTMETTVKNTQGFVLPSTGGMGTILFTIGGIILVGVAATIFVAGRKKKSNE